MRNRWIWLPVIAVVAVLAAAEHSVSQELLDESSFVRMKLKADDGVLILKDDIRQAKYLEGNVDVLLIAEDPVENLHIKADRIDFEYESDENEIIKDDGEEKRTQPKLLKLSGNIEVISRGTRLTSDEAEIDLVAQTVECVGRAMMFHDDGSTGETDGFIYNLETGFFEVDSPRIEIPLN